MLSFDTFVFIVELISTATFGLSGAVIAVKKRMDVFGVVIVGVTTAIGGGILRDILLGIHPPMSFRRPVYAAVAALFSLAAFAIEYRHARRHTPGEPFKGKITEPVLFWLDTAGLASFTAVGVAVAYGKSADYNVFLLVFVGTMTGVGGGVMRDLLCQNMPYIFVKHFYASACVCGAAACACLWEPAGKVAAMVTGMAVITVLRYLARRFRWNLPRVEENGG